MKTCKSCQTCKDASSFYGQSLVCKKCIYDEQKNKRAHKAKESGERKAKLQQDLTMLEIQNISEETKFQYAKFINDQFEAGMELSKSQKTLLSESNRAKMRKLSQRAFHQKRKLILEKKDELDENEMRLRQKALQQRARDNERTKKRRMDHPEKVRENEKSRSEREVFLRRQLIDCMSDFSLVGYADDVIKEAISMLGSDDFDIEKLPIALNELAKKIVVENLGTFKRLLWKQEFLKRKSKSSEESIMKRATYYFEINGGPSVDYYVEKLRYIDEHCETNRQRYMATCQINAKHYEDARKMDQDRHLTDHRQTWREHYRDTPEFLFGKARLSATYLNNYVFELTKEQVFDLASKPCTYCGNMRSLGSYSYHIDRVDNNVGYVLNNCVPCCGVCNRMKANMMLSSFQRLVKNVASNEKDFDFDESEYSWKVPRKSGSYEQYKSNAFAAGRDFDLEKRDFLSITARPCMYCERPANGKPLGIDRLRNDSGYTLDNVVSCCGPCNFLKRDMSSSDFKSNCAKIAAHI